MLILIDFSFDNAKVRNYFEIAKYFLLKNLNIMLKKCFVGKHFGFASTLGSKRLYFAPFGLTPLPPKVTPTKLIVCNFFYP